MKHTLLLFWVLISTCLPALAQERPLAQDTVRSAEVENPRYRIRNFGLGVPTTRDQFLSPLLFSGVSYGRHTSNFQIYPKGIRQYNLYSTTQFLFSRAASLMPAVHGGFDYLYHHQVLSLAKPRLRVYGGGGFNSLANLKFHTGNTNNVFAHDIALTLDASAMAAYSFDLFRQRFVLTNQTTIPVVGVFSRPAYVWSVPYFIWEEEGRFRDAVETATWGNYFRIQNKLSLDFETRRRLLRRKAEQPQLWRLTYAWEYYRINGANQVKYGHQMLQLGKIIKM